MDEDSSNGAKQTNIRVIHLLPNLLTIASVCAGLTAIRFGFEGNFEMAVRLVLAACFGVAPVLILHSWALQDFQSAGWIAVLTYTTCCLLRLARFNVSSRSEPDDSSYDYFVGIPSPAGAVLVMLPMVISFALSDIPQAPSAFVAFYICLIGLLMISRIPTYSFKNVTIDRANAKYFLLAAAVLAAALLIYLWVTLTVLSLAYIGCLFWGYRTSRKPKG